MPWSRCQILRFVLPILVDVKATLVPNFFKNRIVDHHTHSSDHSESRQDSLMVFGILLAGSSGARSRLMYLDHG